MAIRSQWCQSPADNIWRAANYLHEYATLNKYCQQGKLAYLESTWRAIKPDKDCPVPDASGFTSRMKSGRVLIRSEQVNAAYKKLTITKACLYYWENSGSEPQTYIYPFAVLEANTDQQGENSNVQLFVPFANE